MKCPYCGENHEDSLSVGGKNLLTCPNMPPDIELMRIAAPLVRTARAMNPDYIIKHWDFEFVKESFNSAYELCSAATIAGRDGCIYCGEKRKGPFRPLFGLDFNQMNIVVGVVCDEPCWTHYNDTKESFVHEVSEHDLGVWMQFMKRMGKAKDAVKASQPSPF